MLAPRLRVPVLTLAGVIASGQLTMGEKVAEFESAVAEAVGTAHAAALPAAGKLGRPLALGRPGGR